MSDEALIGYTEEQHREISTLVLDARNEVRPYVGVLAKKRKTTHDALRVMILGDEYPIYSPRSERPCVYFTRDLTRDTITIEMFGDDLSGYIDVWIDGVLYRTDCQLGTDELRAWFGFPLNVCRVTAFPGLWEFAFGFDQVAPVFWAEPGPGHSPYSNLQFRGGVLVTYEGWVSVDNGGGDLDTVDVVDTVPFAEGEVSPGAIAIARWSSSVGWFVEKWHCREYRFYPEQR
jgi:hypothetical protein